jgi:phosphopentomutase
MEKTRFYKYYFKNVDKPIIMEAENKATADDMLRELAMKPKVDIDFKKLEDIRVETPIIGISKKTRKKVGYTWVGKVHSSDGWMENTQFESMNTNK